MEWAEKEHKRLNIVSPSITITLDDKKELIPLLSSLFKYYKQCIDAKHPIFDWAREGYSEIYMLRGDEEFSEEEEEESKIDDVERFPIYDEETMELLDDQFERDTKNIYIHYKREKLYTDSDIYSSILSNLSLSDALSQSTLASLIADESCSHFSFVTAPYCSFLSTVHTSTPSKLPLKPCGVYNRSHVIVVRYEEGREDEERVVNMLPEIVEKEIKKSEEKVEGKEEEVGEGKESPEESGEVSEDEEGSDPPALACPNLHDHFASNSCCLVITPSMCLYVWIGRNAPGLAVHNAVAKASEFVKTQRRGNGVVVITHEYIEPACFYRFFPHWPRPRCSCFSDVRVRLNVMRNISCSPEFYLDQLLALNTSQASSSGAGYTSRILSDDTDLATHGVMIDIEDVDTINMHRPISVVDYIQSLDSYSSGSLVKLGGFEDEEDSQLIQFRIVDSTCYSCNIGNLYSYDVCVLVKIMEEKRYIVIWVWKGANAGAASLLAARLGVVARFRSIAEKKSFAFTEYTEEEGCESWMFSTALKGRMVVYMGGASAMFVQDTAKRVGEVEWMQEEEEGEEEGEEKEDSGCINSGVFRLYQLTHSPYVPLCAREIQLIHISYSPVLSLALPQLYSQHSYLLTQGHREGVTKCMYVCANDADQAEVSRLAENILHPQLNQEEEEEEEEREKETKDKASIGDGSTLTLKTGTLPMHVRVPRRQELQECYTHNEFGLMLFSHLNQASHVDFIKTLDVCVDVRDWESEMDEWWEETEPGSGIGQFVIPSSSPLSPKRLVPPAPVSSETRCIVTQRMGGFKKDKPTGHSSMTMSGITETPSTSLVIPANSLFPPRIFTLHLTSKTQDKDSSEVSKSSGGSSIAALAASGRLSMASIALSSGTSSPFIPSISYTFHPHPSPFILNTYSVVLVDCGSGVFVWVGEEARKRRGNLVAAASALSMKYCNEGMGEGEKRGWGEPVEWMTPQERRKKQLEEEEMKKRQRFFSKLFTSKKEKEKELKDRESKEKQLKMRPLSSIRYENYSSHVFGVEREGEESDAFKSCFNCWRPAYSSTSATLAAEAAKSATTLRPPPSPAREMYAAMKTKAMKHAYAKVIRLWEKKEMEKRTEERLLATEFSDMFVGKKGVVGVSAMGVGGGETSAVIGSGDSTAIPGEKKKVLSKKLLKKAFKKKK
ncbi:Villin/Gelsolin like protein [Aduncisulcus paluster]|uniref:Villin/Gelsolin like protein n=1 Tax=Aduncisulcus paluster TaxID=2918883 RepID=A0ABQ5K1W2_9EUKA|nr:Villin/Gelsolin like protein [Aduncisulcus paluster]